MTNREPFCTAFIVPVICLEATGVETNQQLGVILAQEAIDEYGTTCQLF